MHGKHQNNNGDGIVVLFFPAGLGLMYTTLRTMGYLCKYMYFRVHCNMRCVTLALSCADSFIAVLTKKIRHPRSWNVFLEPCPLHFKEGSAIGKIKNRP